MISEYQNGLKNARIYLAANKKYFVVVYDATCDFEDSKFFTFELEAESFAEDWVLGHVTL